MKIIFLNTLELNGGAAIACNRLMNALQKYKIETNLIVCDKQTDNKHTISLNKNVFIKIINKFRFVWERLIIWSYNNFSKNNLFALSIANTGIGISRNKIVKEADIIHIHWINQGFLSLKELKKLTTLGKPIVWTMHDQWSYTGICHYTSGCNKFTDICSYCPKLNNPKKSDLSYKTFKKKKKLYQSNAFTFVGCSRWISGEARKSSLCHEARITSIPNPINITVYNRQDKIKARKSFNLPLDKKLVLFGACNVTDKRKGFDYMKVSCEILHSQKKTTEEDIIIVIFGGKTEEIEALLPFRIHNTGYIRDIQTMVSLYNAVDLFVIPSLEDNLPNTIMEAMACGTPCVGFNTGGIPEMIEHKENGYVAGYKNAKDLAEGINWVLNEADYNVISTNAREKVMDNYSEDIVAKQYIELYKSLLY